MRNPASIMAKERLAPTRKKRRNANILDVVEGLRRRIATHQIPPGARLKEQDVSDEYGISRAHVREALSALAYLGFLDRTPNRGVVTRRFDLPAILQLFDAREVNEGLCARLAARNVAPASWDDLIKLFGEPMESAVARGDLETYGRNYALLRQRLIAAADSAFLSDMLLRLYDMTLMFTRRLLIISDRTKYGLADHQAVLAALRQGNADEAERLRRTTIANVKAAFERYHSYIL